MRRVMIGMLMAVVCGALAQEAGDAIPARQAPARITGYTGMAWDEYVRWADSWAELIQVSGEDRTTFLEWHDKKETALEAFDAKYAAKAGELRTTYATTQSPEEKNQTGRSLKALLMHRAKIAAAHDKQAMSMVPKDVQVEIKARHLWEETYDTYYPAYKLDAGQQALALKICRQYARISANNQSAEKEKKIRVAEAIQDRVLTPNQRSHFNRVGPPKKEKPPADEAEGQKAVYETGEPAANEEAIDPAPAPAAPGNDSLFGEDIPPPPPAPEPKKKQKHDDLFGD